MLELASSQSSGQPVRVGRIAQTHNIPSNFLVQILLQLKSAGLVASTRGASGGYRLVIPPSEITLYDVISVIEGPECSTAAEGITPSTLSVTLSDVWRETSGAQQGILQSVTLADLLDRAEGHAEPMYFI